MEAHVYTSALSISGAKVRIISYITKKIDKKLKKSPSLSQKLREGQGRWPSPMGDRSSLLEAFEGVVAIYEISGCVRDAAENNFHGIKCMFYAVVEVAG